MKLLSSISIFLVLIAFSPLQGQEASGSDITLSPEAEAAIASGDEEALAKAIETLVADAVADIAPEDIEAIEAVVSRVSAAVGATVVWIAVESGASAEAISDVLRVAAEAIVRAAAKAGVSAPAMVAVAEQFNASAEAAAAEANVEVEVPPPPPPPPPLDADLIDADIIVVSPETQAPG